MISPTKTASDKKNNNKNYNQSPIVKGKFPRFKHAKNQSLFKFNFFLSSSLLIAIITSMISYSIVIAKENHIIAIHNKTNDLNYENIELQNQVDYARSFYNINNKVAKVSFLKKADKVIEVKPVTSLIPTIQETKDEGKIKTVSGY